MKPDSILYYPHIEFQNVAWVKSSLLLWNHVYSITDKIDATQFCLRFYSSHLLNGDADYYNKDFANHDFLARYVNYVFPAASSKSEAKRVQCKAKRLAFLRRLPSESNFGEAKAKQNECNVKQNGSLFYACPNEKIPSAATFLARGDALLCAFRDSGAIS